MAGHPESVLRTDNVLAYAKYFSNTGRWAVWVRPTVLGGTNSWIFVGSHSMERLAARCQDQALLKLETDPTMTLPIQLNFQREDYEEDQQLRNTLSRDEFFDLLRKESCDSNNNYRNWSTTTACLGKFLAQEQFLGNMSTMASLEGPFFNIDLSNHSADEHRMSDFSSSSWNPHSLISTIFHQVYP